MNYITNQENSSSFYSSKNNYINRKENQFTYNKNKFVYVKQNVPPQKSHTILVNPHFQKCNSTKVFINPNFNKSQSQSEVKPKVHLNPNLFGKLNALKPHGTAEFKSFKPSTEAIDSYQNEEVKQDAKIVNSRYQLSCVGTSKINTVLSDVNSNRNNSNQLKLINTNLPVSSDLMLNKSNNTQFGACKQTTRRKFISRTKIINHVIKTPVKIHKISPSKLMTISRSRYKIKKIPKPILKEPKKTINTTLNSTPKRNSFNRKRFVYINKLHSLSFIAKNVVYKNSRLQRSYININGVLYHSNPCSLRKSDLSPVKSLKVKPQLKKNNPNTQSKLKKNLKKSPNRRTETIPNIYKLNRNLPLKQIKNRYLKLKKNNVSCSIYKKYGRCRLQEKGSCNKLHDPNQIILCPRFLQGACIKNKCLLSHKVSPEKMPTCKYYLEGLCSKTDCQYLHVKISSKADICKDFLNGFCQEGMKCNKRHQFLCPDFEKNKKCSRRRCPFPHNQPKILLKKKPKILKKNKCPPIKTIKDLKVSEEDLNDVEGSKRYFCDANKEHNIEDNIEKLKPKRPKLGELPAFIPLQKIGRAHV